MIAVIGKFALFPRLKNTSNKLIKGGLSVKHDMYELPESLYEFAQIYDFHGVIEDLAAMAEDEDWNYHNTTGASNLPILENYVRNTYIRLSREKKVAYSTDSKFCCFDTGLLSRIQHEPIYM